MDRINDRVCVRLTRLAYLRVRLGLAILALNHSSQFSLLGFPPQAISDFATTQSLSPPTD